MFSAHDVAFKGIEAERAELIFCFFDIFFVVALFVHDVLAAEGDHFFVGGEEMGADVAVEFADVGSILCE